MDALVSALLRHHREYAPPQLLEAPEVHIVPKPEPKMQPISMSCSGGVTATFGGYAISAAKIRFGEWSGVKFASIIQAVCQYYRLRKIDLVSQRRTKSLCRPRQVAMYLGRELTTLSYPGISKMLGGRDHTTAMHGAKRIALELESDDELQADINALLKSLSGQD